MCRSLATWGANTGLAPTDEFGFLRVNERIVLTGGTGILAKAVGRGTGHGYASLPDGQVTMDGRAGIRDLL